MLEPGDRVAIAGVSVRAMAASAVRAGYRVTAIDAFGDSDLCAVADVTPLRRGSETPYTALAAARLAATAAGAALGAAYTANFENYPEAVAQLANGRRLLGNAPETLARVRSPVAVMRTLHQLGFPVPMTRMTVPTAGPNRGWLQKPRLSGGGHGVRPWRHGTALGRTMYLQQRIGGMPGSIAFVADGRDAVPLGLTRQLAGDAVFGARRFAYCGSLLSDPKRPLFDDEGQVRHIAAALADAVTRTFGLVGVNGIDFIVRDGVPYPIEVNPRYSASMELVERAYGLSMFELHVRACGGQLPRQRPYRESSGGTHGKAIVFAAQDCVVGDTRPWLTAEHGVKGNTMPWLTAEHADIPHAGERIGRGKPVCTVFARGRDGPACYEALIRRAAAVHDQVRQWPAERRRRRSTG